LQQELTSKLLKASDAAKTAHEGETLRFKFVSLLEPPKASLIPYLDAERSGAPLPSLPRLTNMLFSVGTGSALKWYEGLFDQGTGKLTQVELAAKHKPQGDPEEIIQLET
jgi:primary-amine oxidase